MGSPCNLCGFLRMYKSLVCLEGVFYPYIYMTRAVLIALQSCRHQSGCTIHNVLNARIQDTKQKLANTSLNNFANDAGKISKI